jgi:hypothetical protein
VAYLSAHEEEHLREISLRGVSFRGLGAVFVLWVVVWGGSIVRFLFLVYSVCIRGSLRCYL